MIGAHPVASEGLPKGKAEHCIFIWLGGGMCQLDTFDPKRRGNSRSSPKVAGTDYASIETVVPGVRFTEHLARTARVADRLTAIRTVNHTIVDEHAFATNYVHTGRMISGTITYPSIGSLVAHQRGAASEDVPAYMLIGYPNVSRGPGYLGPSYSAVHLVDTRSGPAGFTQPEGVSASQRKRRQEFVRNDPRPIKERSIARYAQLQEQARRWAGPRFMRNFALDEESSELRGEYGGEFGQRCLLARRLTEAGVRFVEVSHNLNFLNGTGWDTHFEGQQNQHVLIQELDAALATLIRDLEKRQLLEKTLVVVGTEFGRPAEFDNRGGRGHQGTAFSLILAGGGLRHCGAYGVTDEELGKQVVENAVSIPDFHATIYAALGIDPAEELRESGRPVPITDGGVPIQPLFA